MNYNKFPLLNEEDQKNLYDALHYMNLSELKESCENFSIVYSSKKAEIIKSIMFFMKTGNILKIKKIPAPSIAKNYPPQSIEKNALMLYGSYKNDAKTRSFFKKLIGPNFHFTAFGIDWLNERWLKGEPPTYQEFADYWIKETNKRKNEKAKPKQEWAYINFLQRANKLYPNMSKIELMKAWKELRKEKVKLAQEIIKKIIKNKNQL